MNCLNCNIELEGKRDGAKFCSPNCRVTFSRKQSVVTDNVTLSDVPVTDNFKFTITRNDKNKDDNPTRQARYWYEMPLSAVPVYSKGWPKMPDFMNGRQYFLWWKNEFKVSEDSKPVILNPFPKYENLHYEMGGEGSRKWGA